MLFLIHPCYWKRNVKLSALHFGRLCSFCILHNLANVMGNSSILCMEKMFTLCIVYILQYVIPNIYNEEILGKFRKMEKFLKTKEDLKVKE